MQTLGLLFSSLIAPGVIFGSRILAFWHKKYITSITLHPWWIEVEWDFSERDDL